MDIRAFFISPYKSEASIMAVQSASSILTWSRNTPKRCAAGEPPIRFLLSSSASIMLRCKSILCRIAGAMAGEQGT
jgi:hypothetical protein